MQGLLTTVFRNRDGRMRGWCVALLVAVLLPMLAGCYGQFPATRAVYKLNGDVHENGAVQSLVMWVLAIIPVYGVATFADVFIFNLIEFWSGESIEIGSTVEKDGVTYALEPSDDGGRATMTASRDGTVLAQAHFIRTAAGEFEVRDAEGTLAGKVVRAADGSLELTDAQGTLVRTVSAKQLASARE
ncbi:DUF3332 family protein [bacterium]|nr:DUF3332 family protein [bacterium]